MRYAVVGGDRRAVLLASQLAAEGHRVHSWALEKAELPGEITKDSTLQAAAYGADCVILPAPAEKGGLLYAPLGLESGNFLPQGLHGGVPVVHRPHASMTVAR